MGVTTYTIKHGPRRHILRPWLRDCACRFEDFPCPPVRLGMVRPAIRTVWVLW
jgi:hypothetical protein